MGLSSYADDEEYISLDGLHAPDEVQTEIPQSSPTVRLGDLETVFNTTDSPDKTPDILHGKTLTGTAVPEPLIEDRENTAVKTTSSSDQLPDQYLDELFASALIQHLVRTKKGAPKKKTDTYYIFSHQIDLEELLLDLGIDIPKQDKTQLKHLQKQKLESRSTTRLKSYLPATDQYVQIPRITRFVHQGTIYPCTDILRPLRRHQRTYVIQGPSIS